ncbi:receptor-like protein 6 [Vigna umbellata]|uniref:receptor-like protein 6 n=1 Tax=Vigna umbellata TaxID=87088 RepID=UPI001F5FDA90|nr:receptor-like protein 6 [Vigna umbellata]
MGWILVSYLIIFQSLLHFSSYHCLSCNPDDKSVLLQFKNSVAVVGLSTSLGPCGLYSQKTASWNNETDCCGWNGVRCDSELGHVIGLDLSCSPLKGELLGPNSSIFKLSHLQQLNLLSGDLDGSPIHSAIGDLVSLTDLTLYYLRISGDVPSTISHFSKLEHLDLTVESLDSTARLDSYTWNRLINNATNLREIFLRGVDMSSVGESSLSLLTNLSSTLLSVHLTDTKLQGTWPTDIFRLPNLQEIRIVVNENLTGELPNSNWTTPLRSLFIYQTNFSGNIPDSIAHLKSLKSLSLFESNFDGFIPPSLFDLTHLYLLHLSDNKLVGPIPAQITKLSKLSILDLSGNMLNGSIPLGCYSLPSLSIVDLTNNQLTGSIGEFSTNSLKILKLSNNKLEGNFPNSIFHLQSLVRLNLSSLKLDGVVYFHRFSNLTELQDLDLSNNSFLNVNFENNVDYTLLNLSFLYLSSCNVSSFPNFSAPHLIDLDISHNIIHGSFPKRFQENLLLFWNKISYIDLSFNKLQGRLPILPNGIQYFSMSNNELSGDISSALCNASTLSILNLASNNFSGLIPQCLATFPSLWALDLQDNNLYGSIPDNFSEGNAFKTLKLNGNHLKGPLPQTLNHCTKLEVLDLGNNDIEDTFPSWLETLPTLQVLSLQSNKFHGNITSLGTKLSFPRLRIFDISNNNFTGPLPTSYIVNFKEMMNVDHNQTGSTYLSNRGTYNDSIVLVMKGEKRELTRIFTTWIVIDLSNRAVIQ